MRRDHIANKRKCFVTDYDAARLRDRLQSRCQISFGANDRIIHTFWASEIPNVAITGIDPHPHPKGMFNSRGSPFCVEFRKTTLHFPSHLQTGRRIYSIAPGFRIAKKNQHCIASELVDGAAVRVSDRTHLCKILVEEFGDQFGLKSLGSSCEVLYI